jgi:predicted regulator of Ras-like GTPase activity (Roadblock/LC7/MglB family)
MSDTVFNQILAEVVRTIPGARGAIFLDWEGESVDDFSNFGNTNLRLLGAHWGIVFFQASAILKRHHFSPPSAISIRFTEQQVIIRRVTDEYLVLLALDPEANSGQALHLLKQAEEQLREQM